MEQTTDKSSVYDKLTPERKQLVDMVLQNLETEEGLWKKGWRVAGAPESAITHKKYRGLNNFVLTLISMRRGYNDNRWLTFLQMEEKNWRFKTDEEGKSLGKGAGVPIEYFELRDKLTKKPYSRALLFGMTDEEKDEYEKENVYALRKYYRVFNAEIIDGIPAIEKYEIDETGKNDRAEKMIDYWDQHEAKIFFGGHQAYYTLLKDEIHLPERNDFYGLPEFYSTALHEIGHSTGHETRLNRKIANNFGSSEYAQEELRAEIASMFLEQDFTVSVTESHIRNNSSYIQSWQKAIMDNPNALFLSIADADKIAKFILSKEQQKEIEPYSIASEKNENGDEVFKVYMCAANGQTICAINYAFASREALLTEFEKMQCLSHWAGKEFKELTFDELETESRKRAEELNVKEEKSEVYIKPSIVARAVRQPIVVDMTEKGIESLTRMCDREIVERAGKARTGEKFTKLYNGDTVFGKEDKDERSLMARVAMFCADDQDQLLRIFRSSGQFRQIKPNSYYTQMAVDAIQFIAKAKPSKTVKTRNQSTGRGNAKM